MDLILKNIPAALVSALLIFLPARLSAETIQGDFIVTGNTLFDKCRSEELVANGICAGYAAGLLDSAKILQAWGLLPSFICTPGNVTVGQLVEIATKQLNENPQDLHLSAASIILDAYQKAFPCPPETK